MKEFFKTRKGKITIGVIALLILVGIILIIVFSGSSRKDGQKEPGGITIEQGKDGNSQQEEEINTEGGLEIGDSLSESEDSLSVSGEKENPDQDELSVNNGNFDNAGSSLSEDKTPNDEGSENGSETENNDGSVPKEAYGVIY